VLFCIHSWQLILIFIYEKDSTKIAIESTRKIIFRVHALAKEGRTIVKIHIIGSSGSGKTTLAADISSQFHIHHHDLDKVDWEEVDIIAIAEQSVWITEGIYLIWTEPLLYHADCIFCLLSRGL
jgi:Fe-S cluster assembly ATPase SufC